jgi:hypothetical protein
MALASALKRNLPRVNLSTIFVLFFCVAVGLAISPNPIDAVQPTIVTGMIVGLVQQSRQLLRARKSVLGNFQFSFALRFAVLWRTILAAIMTTCIAAHLLISQNLWHEPTRSDLIIYGPSLDVVIQLSMIVVLSDSVRRWQPQISLRKARLSRIVAKWMLALVLILLMQPDVGMMYYLVHIATAGIEFAHPVRFQRPGAFPDQYQEGFRLFWITSSAVVLLSMAALFLVIANVGQRTRRARLVLGVGFAVTILLIASFCIWYYGKEFYHISPDLASAGFPGTWFDWVAAATIGGILVTAGACRLTRQHDPRILVSENISDASRDPAIHESAPGLFRLASVAIVEVLSIVKQLIDFSPIPGIGSLWQAIAYLLTSYLPFYLFLGVFILAVQFCWPRWRRRNEPFAWELVAVDRTRFFWNWVGLAMLATVGLPTLSAYSFIYWLGPWYLYGPK